MDVEKRHANLPEVWLKGGRQEADAHGGDDDTTGRQEHSRNTQHIQ